MIRKKRIHLFLCVTILLYSFSGCGHYLPYMPTASLFPSLEYKEETTAPPETTTEETTAGSLLKNGVYTCTLYSLTVPAGWSCNGYDSSVEIEAPEAINNIIPNISVTVGPCDGEFSKITFDDMKKNFGTLLKDIEKISFGIKTIGENECLIVEFSYSVLGMQQFVSQAIVHAGSQDLTFTLVRDSLMTASAEFQNVLESLEINPLAQQS